MGKKKIIAKHIIEQILNDNFISQRGLAKKYKIDRKVIRRIFKDAGIIKRYYINTDVKIPIGAKKKEFFNYDVYSSGHVFNRNSKMWLTFKSRKRVRTIRGKEYLDITTKRSSLIINHNGTKKTISISLANLIGILFVPNPNRHKYIHFKEGGRNNCDYKNLYWSDAHVRSGRIKIMPQKLKRNFSDLEYEKLSRFNKPVYDCVMKKNIQPLMNMLKTEKKYLIACMTDAWKRCKPEEKPNRTIIIDAYDTFVSDRIVSLLERGFYVPKNTYYPDDKSFLFYCRENLMGTIKDYLFRKRPKQRKLNEAFLPSQRGRLVSRQHHEFSE